MTKDYKRVVDTYSEQQLNKCHEIISLILECAYDASKEERNFLKDMDAIEQVQKILEDCINYDPNGEE